MDRQERGQARRKAVMKWAGKHKKQQKPLAPIEPLKKAKGQERQWIWIGEDIPSKDLWNSGKKWITYTKKQIQEAGFRLPKLKKKGE